MKRKILRVILVMVIFLSILSFLSVSAASRNKIKLNKKSLTISVGKKVALKVTTKTKVKWKSSNKKIATVNAKGVVKAKKVGSVKIIARVGKIKAICSVKVKKNRVDNQLKKTPIPTVTTPIPTEIATTPVPSEANDKIVITVQQDNENPKKINYTVFNGRKNLICFGVIPILEKEENGDWYKVPYKIVNGLSVVGDPLAVPVETNSEWSYEISLDDYFDNISSGKYRIKFDGISIDVSAIFTIE